MRILLSDNSQDKLKDSFRKLQDYIFFENTDLHIRGQLADFLAEDGIEKLDNLLTEIKKPAYQDKLLNKIKLRYFPKAINADVANFEKGIHQNFITNVTSERGCSVERLSIFCDIPIELHIVSVLWILEHGYKLDLQLEKCVYGNRLILFKEKLLSGRALFKPYIKQYHKWWADGIDAAKDLLNSGDDVTIINFDFKDFFHSVQFDFRILDKALLVNLFGEDPIHKLFKRMHEVYALRLAEINHPSYKLEPNHYPLPIGLLSSFVLANWHLKKLDSFINSKYAPNFYGRYVDDFLIVLKGKILREGNENLIHEFISKHLGDLFKKLNHGEEVGYKVNLSGLENLTLQNDKIFIYQFDAKYSPNLLTKFIEEQKERSSEFRFLSDQEDDNFGDFEENIFESNFETEDLNKARFRKLEENRFKISSYLAKLIQRIIERGVEYKAEEIDKVEKYFKGYHSIKYYFFWEKLFTLYVVSNKPKYFKSLIETITTQLERVNTKYTVGVEKFILTDNLSLHLTRSIEMAIGLDPTFLSKEINESLVSAGIPAINPFLFRKFGLLRKQYVYYPLLQLSDKAKNTDFSLVDRDAFKYTEWKESDFQVTYQEFIPFRVKFYECALYEYNRRLFSRSFEKGNNKREITDIIPVEAVLNQAFEFFYTINSPASSASLDDIKKEYFDVAKIYESTAGVSANEIYFKSSDKPKKDYRIGLVSQYVSIGNIKASIDGKPILNGERVETFSFILDQISMVKNLDLFIMPEVSLPLSLVKKFSKFSVDNQCGFVSGIEHIRRGDAVINLIITCLPISVDGDKDAVPIFRVKNHYAPEEEELIWDKNLIPLKPKTYSYDLFEWRGLYFSSYYCFELANIHHRTIFYSKVDLICASVWNADTHYYSNIVESTTRDLHCFFVQVNTSQYGDSRITRPTDHVRKDKAKVKGGTVPDYKINLLIGDITVDELRQFQKLDYTGQRKEVNGKKPFKPTPPDFPIKNILIRENNERFFDGTRRSSDDLPF